MSQLPIFLIGRNVSAVTLTLLAVAADGTLSDSTAYTLTGVIDEVEYNGQTSLESIPHLTSARDHMVAVQTDDSITLVEVLQAASSSAYNLLATAFFSASDYARVAITRGSGSWTFTALMESYEETLQRGKTVGRLVLRQTDLGNATANPSYAD